MSGLVSRTCVGTRWAAVAMVRKCRGTFLPRLDSGYPASKVSARSRLGLASLGSRLACFTVHLLWFLSAGHLARDVQQEKRCRLFFLSLHLAITALTSPPALRYVMLYRKGRRGCPCYFLRGLMMSLSYDVLGYRTKGRRGSLNYPGMLFASPCAAS